MFNKVILSGYLVRDPERSYTTTGKERGIFTLAVKRYKNDTDFFHCVCYEPVTKSLSYIKKGSLILLEGRLQNYKLNDGSLRSQILTDKITFFPKTMQPVVEEAPSEVLAHVDSGGDYEDISF